MIKFVTTYQLVQSMSFAIQDTIGQVIEFTCFKDAQELPSTLAHHRKWRGEVAAIGNSQVKVLVVLYYVRQSSSGVDNEYDRTRKQL